VSFEFTDAKGEVWASLGGDPGDWNVGDWDSRSNINFDGWRYLSVALPRPYSDGHPGVRDRNWRYRLGDRKVDYPIRFTRLFIELRDQLVHVTDMVPVPDPAIRIRCLTAGYGPLHEGPIGD
jgi:hypothetical protein